MEDNKWFFTPFLLIFLKFYSEKWPKNKFLKLLPAKNGIYLGKYNYYYFIWINYLSKFLQFVLK